MIDINVDLADPAIYGWKAHYLSRVAKIGLAVPHAFALSPSDSIESVPVDEHRIYAVRSSGIGEDSAEQSYAGHFRTHLGVTGAENVREAIADVRASAADEMPMGVVVQEMVEAPRISGVAFSVDPVTLDTSAAVVAWVDGLGDGLVSGATAGNDLRVDLTAGTRVDGEWPHAQESLRVLVDGLRQLRDLLDQPVDIEWSISAADDFAILQLRPIVLPSSGIINLDGSAAIASLPGSVRSHDKLELRTAAAALGVPMSRARAVLGNARDGIPDVRPFLATERSAGRSVVLLHPTHLDGKVIREFTKDCGTDVEFFVRGCQRYAIRQYPEQGDAVQTVIETLTRGLDHAAFACVIEQEILHAYATGILRKTADGYLIEIALGHFVPKGYVETTAFALSDDLALLSQVQTPQTKAYHFLNGHVITETPPYEALSLREGDLAMVIDTLRPILRERPGAAVEFGLLGHPGELTAYLIDVADLDCEVAAPTVANLARGVVSSGIAQGPIIDLRNSTTSDDLNAHLYDTVRGGGVAELSPAIYVAKAASVDLLPVVRAAHPDSGFIFERASVLAHLPVVLRERGLAAVTMQTDQIGGLVASGLPLRINTADTVAVTTVEIGVWR